MTFSPTDAADAYAKFPNKDTRKNPEWFQKGPDPKIIRKHQTKQQVVRPSRQRNQKKTSTVVVETKEEQHWFFPTLDENAKESVAVQPKMTQLIKELNQDSFCNQMRDKHTEQTVGTRKPDLVHYRRGQPEDVFNIICLGEIKGRRSKAKFNDEEIGHILEMTESLATLQPFRSEFTCYITDTKFIQFFKITFDRTVDTFKLHT